MSRMDFAPPQKGPHARPVSRGWSRTAASAPATRLAAGVTFTDEPGIYIPDELGIRHEDTVAVTESGCENLAPKWSGTPEEPGVV